MINPFTKQDDYALRAPGYQPRQRCSSLIKAIGETSSIFFFKKYPITSLHLSILVIFVRQQLIKESTIMSFIITMTKTTTTQYTDNNYVQNVVQRYLILVILLPN